MPRRVSDDMISRICDENDIIDYVSQYVQLKKSGRDYSGLCPFHHEKTPSFHVSQEKQLFHCFGCGASGNLVQFVMRTENLDFIDSLKLLADKAGIVIPEDDDGFSDEKHEKKKRILEMNKLSARFFYNCLKDKSIGEKGQHYFVKRNIPWKTVTVYGLGFAPDSRDMLIKHLASKGFSIDEIVEGGLAVRRDGKIYDKFRNRVMFPIIDVRGNVIGFGGRIMDDNKEVNGYKIPKYLNSPETPAFDKGRNLFSLNLAKNAKASEIILCEGYMDVISVYQAGIKNIVATLGTAITENQAKLMLRYAGEILICYDSDEAGTKAALKAIDIIHSVGGRSRVIRLKNAKDPDEYINKNGVEKFKEAIKNAMPSTEFKISLIKKQYDTTTTDGKILFIEEAAKIFAGIRDAVEIDAYITKVAEDTGISRDAILSKYREKTSKNKGNYPRIPTKTEYQKKTERKERETIREERTTPGLIAAEKRLLGLISQNRKLYKMTEKRLKAEEFSTRVYRKLAGLIYDSYTHDNLPEPSIILNSFSGDELSEASEVFYNLEVYSGDEATVRELLYTIILEKLDIRINSETNAANLAGLFRERERVLEEKNTWEE
ncbi:MAG: DNA primase [Oscillospiraceae bacterium]|nr:DNA primase [Oscillospiraceae bacterium]